MSDLKNTKLFVYPIFLLFFMISFYRVAGSIPLVLMVMSFLVLTFKNKEINFKLVSKTYLIILLIYFFISLLSLFFLENLEVTKTKLVLKISIIILPFLLMFFKNYFKIKKKKLLYISLLGQFVSLIVLLVNASIKYKDLGFKAFQYIEFVGDFFMSPIIYSSALNINILIAFYTIEQKKFFLKYSIVLFLSLGVLLASSKIGILILAFNLLFFAVYEIKNNSKKIFYILLPFVLTIFLLFYFNKLDKVFNRFIATSYYFEKREKPNMNQKFPREIIWKTSIGLIKENFLLGVGLGNTNNKLHTKFKEIGFGKGIKHKFNAHNQFLETFLASGIFGFLSLVLIFAYLFKISLQNKDKHLLHTLIIITLYCSIESYFESQMGLYLFCMFSSLFLIKEKKYS